MNKNNNINKTEYISPDINENQCRPDECARADIGALKSAASQIIQSTREQIFLRECDRLLILRPNRMYFVNKTALHILKKLYSPDYHSHDRDSINFAVDIERIADECAYFYKIDKITAVNDIQKLIQTLASLLASQNAIPYVDRYPTPQLKMTGFSSHELYYPVLSEIALTYRCQLKCSFCYAGIGSCKNPRLDHNNHKNEMSVDEIKKTIDIISGDAHCPTISFTGGEPTLRFDELAAAVAYAKSKNMRVNLITNGIALADPLKTRALKNAGLDSAQVSIEGADALTHDNITGVTGSFNKSLDAVKNLKAESIHVHTNSTLTSDNFHSVYNIPALVSELGLKYFSVNMVIKTGNANINHELLINYTNIGGHIDTLQKKAQDAGVKLVWYSPTPYCLFNPVSSGLGSKSCAAASGLLSISPYGEVLPCSSFKDSLGNILKKPFEQIWSSRAARYFRNKEFMPPVCGGCDKKNICQGACPLYWDACGNFSEIEKIMGAKLYINLKNIAWKVKRKLAAPKYGI
ncbi:MAG TPA: radical SAM protein [Candidatus Wallbacteria bacterium]|nr:radical SAM protein [Candidatus Wallbacteria bacterium]